MEKLGKYEIRSVLGRGAMGTVYEGWDPVISRRVAIKTVRLPDSDDSEEREVLGRFQQEAQAAGRLHHPNIVGVFDYAETSEVAYIVMEFVDGRTVKSVVDAATAAGVRTGLVEVGRLMDGLLSGLAYSHGNGVIHRDIKPANIIVTAAGQVKIADFGIARLESSTMTQAGSIMGTPAYMSPEQFQGGAIDSRTDIYSAGIVLFQLLTGKRPFEGSMATIMHSVLTSAPPQLSTLEPSLPPGLQDVVSRAIARTAEGRFADAGAFNVALQAALGGAAGTGAGMGGGARPASGGLPDGLGDLLGDDPTVVRGAVRPTSAAAAAKREAKAGSRVPLLLGVAAVALLVAGGGAFWALSGGRGTGTVVATNGMEGGSSARTAPVAPPAATPAPSAEAPGTVAPAVVAPTPPAAVVRPSPQPSSAVPPAAVPASPPAATMPEARVQAPAPEPVTPSPTSPAPMTPATPVPGADPGVLTPARPAITEGGRRQLATALRGAACSFVTGDELPRGVVLHGVVGVGEATATLQGAVEQALPGVPVELGVQGVDARYCGLLDLLRPYARGFGQGGRTLQLGLPDGREVLVAGELVRPRLVFPDGPSQLELDYVANDGSVLHMHESKPGPGYGTDANAGFGDPRPGFKGWGVDEPFGTDLVVAVTTPAPLFRAGQVLPDGLEGYLRELRAALGQAKGGRVSVAVLPVRTKATP